MMKRRNSLVLAIAFALSLSVFAQDPAPAPAPVPKQDPPPAPAKQDPTFDDLKNSLGELQEKQDKEDGEKREKQIQRNYEDTLKIYNNALGGGKGGDLANITRRLEINLALEAKYAKQLEKGQGDLATMRAQFINRTMNLKKSVDEGKLSKEAYEKLLAEDTKRFRNREKEIIEDMAFFNDEISNARKLSKELALKKELLQFDPFDPNKKEEIVKESARKDGLAESLKKTVSELSGYKTRSVLDYLK